LVIQKLGSKSGIHHVPYDQAYGQGFEDMVRRVPCLEKIKKLTGWQPEISLDTCIDLVASHIEQRGRWQAEKVDPPRFSIAAGS
jgi:UDP-glucose 4-epimerase